MRLQLIAQVRAFHMCAVLHPVIALSKGIEYGRLLQNKKKVRIHVRDQHWLWVHNAMEPSDAYNDAQVSTIGAKY